MHIAQKLRDMERSLRAGARAGQWTEIDGEFFTLIEAAMCIEDMERENSAMKIQLLQNQLDRALSEQNND